MSGSNTINIGLNVSSNGTTEKETKLAKGLNQELERAAKASTRVPSATAAARQGVNNSRDSGTARGIGGQTGAEGRDFAKQASGLGGLVHVYATFAANLFAISAGFQALSKAANISNMVKGLDQLGAASGRNLGTTAKQLAAVTDGAVSLQEALTATAQASAAGITSSNILRMGEVAKRASQALGRDMTDSLSRLSRGITKIEPELLDELGIMVKVDQATQNYARTLGKSASSLTDFEKRQAFANEVLSQAEQKFGSIKLDANPYQKISASIANLTQNGLELVNKVLTPLLDALSRSPVALAGVLGGIATLLLKQALPALTQWKQGLRDSADAAANMAVETAKLRKVRAELFTEKDAVNATASVISATAKQKKAIDDLQLAAQSKAVRSNTVGYKSAISTEIDDETKLANAKKATNKYTEELNKSAGQMAASKVNQLKTEIELQKQLIVATEQRIAANALLQKYEGETAKKGLAKFFDIQNLNNRIADKAESRKNSTNIISNAVANAGSIGIKDTFAKLLVDLNNAKKGIYEVNGELTNGKPMKTWVTNMILVKATVGIVTSTITTLASALGNVFAIVGVAVVAFQLLDSWLGKSSKEFEAFNSSTDTVKANIEGLNRTLENISSKSIDQALSTSSIQAKATAVLELSDALNKQSKDFDKLITSMNGWEKFWDFTKGIFNFGLVDKMASTAKDSVDSLLNSFSNVKQLDKFKQALEQVYGKGVTSEKAVEAAIAPLSRAEALDKANQLAKAVAAISSEASNAIAPATAFEAALVEASKTAADLTNSLRLTDPFSKMAASLIGLDQLLDKALVNPLESISAIISLIDNKQLSGIIPKGQVEVLLKAKTELANLNKEQKQYNDAILANDKLLNKLQEEQKDKDNVTGIYGVALNLGRKITGKDGSAEIAATKAEGDKLRKLGDEATAKAESAAKRISEELLKPALFDAAITNLQVGLKFAFAQAAITGAKALNSTLATLGVDTTVADAKLREKEIGLRVAEINAKGSFLKAQIENTLETRKLRLVNERLALDNEYARKPGPLSPEDLNKYNSSVLANTKEREAVTKGENLLNNSSNKLPNAKDNKEAIGAVGIDNYMALLGLQAQKAAAGAEAPAAKLSTLLAGTKEIYTEKGRILDLDIQRNKLLADEYAVSNSIAGTHSAEAVNLIAEVEQKRISLAFTKESLAIESTLAGIKTALNSGLLTDEQRIKSEKQQSLLSDQLSIMTKQKTVNLAQVEFDTFVKLFNIKEQLRQSEIESNRRIYDARVSLQQELLSLEEKILSVNESSGVYSDTEIAKQKTAVSIAKQQLDNETTILNLVRSQEDARRALSNKIEITSKIAKNDDGSVKNVIANEDLKAQQVEYARLTSEQATILDITKKTTEAKLAGVEATNKQVKAQAAHNDLMKELESFGNSLSLVFGKVGNAIGEVAKNMAESAKQTNLYNEEKKRLEDISNNSESPVESMKAYKALGDLNNKQAKREQDDQLKNLSIIKSGFKEKTFAYKAIDAIEKANHLMSLARMAEQLAITVASIGTSIAAGVSKLFAQGGFAGFVGAAAFLALMASLGFSGGSAKAPPAGFTAEEKQKTAGTGQTYQGSTDGKLVDRAGGVLGDPTAVAKAIEDSITILSKETFGQMSPQLTTMIMYLKGIEDNTKQLAKNIISTGIFGTSPLGVKESSSKTLGGILGSSSTTIEDQGIKIIGSLDTLSNGIGTFEQYVNTLSKSSGVLGLFSSSSTGTKTETLDPAIQKNIADIFKSVNGALVSAGIALEGSGTRVADIIKQFPIEIDASSKGLSATEFANKLISEISVKLNAAAEQAFPYMSAYVKIGEEYYTTVARIVKEGNTLNKGLQMIGVSLSIAGDSAEQAVAKQQNIVDKFSGGIDEFESTAQFFFDNFKTDSQKTTYYTEQLSDSLKDLHINTIPTKQGFIDLVTSLDLAKDADATLYAGLIKLAPAMDKVANAAEKLRTDTLSQTITNLRLEGNATKALNLQREEELKNLNPLLVMGKKQQYQLEDEAAARKLSIEILNAEGKSYKALIIQREDELALLTESQKLLKLQVYEAQDAAKTESYTIALLEAQGRSQEALNLKRAKELIGLSDVDAALVKLTHAAIDYAKTESYTIALLEAQGRSQEALNLKRAKELIGLSDVDAALVRSTHAAQDLTKIHSLQIEILNALGFAFDAVQMQRGIELLGLSEEERMYKKKIYAALDNAKTESLQVELMEASGDATGALIARRKLELKGLSATDAALKTRIWLLQDEKNLLDKKVSQEARIYELLGKSEEALRITRAQELATLDPQLVASQLYIYALEDEATIKEKLKTAYDRESSALKDTISKTKDFTKTLREYRDSLLLGDNSILTPAQKYAEAKRQYLQTAAIATSLAVTDAQKAAQSDAVSKLPSVSDNFLQASKVLYASSDAYTNDFNSVLDLLDKTANYFDGQESEAQQTLDILTNSNTIQGIIAENTESTASLLAKYLAAQTATETARVGAATGGSAAAGGTFSNPVATATTPEAYIEAVGSGWIHGKAGWSGTFAEGQAIIVDALSKIDAGTMTAQELISALITQGITGSMLDTILGKSQGTSSAWAIAHGLPAFAGGGLARGMSIVGEQGPEVVDFRTPGRVYSNNQTNSMFGSNQELIKEIQSLKDEVKQLRAEQHEQTGHLIKANYDANNMNAQILQAAQVEAANATQWRQRAAPRLA